MAQDKLQGKQRGQGRPQTQTQTKSVPQKRQVRRRLHTTRPYQERLLNMAEARKEIVTALKFHRASMKQQQQHHQIESTVYEKQQTPPPPPPISPTSPPSSTNHCFYPNSTPLSTITLNNMSILPDQTLGLSLNFQGFTDMDASTLYTHTIDSSSILQPCFSPSSLSHLSPPLSSSSPPPDSTYNSLPFFNTCRRHHHHHHQMQQTGITHDPTTENSDQQLSHLTHLWLEGENSDQQLSHLTHLWLDGENSDHLSHLTHLQLDGENSDHISQSTHLELDGEMNNNNSNNFGFHSSLHPRGLDNEQMEEIRTIGKRHQIEWNDTLSLVNSAWWSKFLNTMESGSGLLKVGDDGFGQEVMESNTYGWPALYYPPGIHNQTFHANHDDLPCMDTQDEEYWLS